jgi:flagellar assembly factor FliW
MKLKTKPFGVINIEDKQKISFSRGIFGFDNIREYALLNASQWPFFWLQAVEVPDLAFILIDPVIFRPDYTPDVDENDLAELGLKPEDRDKMLVFSIVTVPDDQKKMTANLQGPIIINRENRSGRQLISTSQKWNVRHLIMDELAEKGGGRC